MSKKIQQLDVNVLGQNWKIDLTDYVEMLDLTFSPFVQNDTLYIEEDYGLVMDDILKLNKLAATVENNTLILKI